jgi:hypothetical protein
MFTGFEGGNHADGYAEGVANLYGNSDLQTSIAKHGSFGLQVTPATTALAFASVRPPGGDGTLTFGNMGTHEIYCSFWFYVAAAPGSNEEQMLVVNHGGTATLSLRLKSDCKIALYNETGPTLLGTTAAALDLDTWYRLECKQVHSDSSYELKVNGASVLSGTVSWGSGIISGVYAGKMSNLNGQGVSLYYDDMVLCTGGYITQPHKVLVYHPDANGNYTAWSADYRAVDDSGDPDNTATKAQAANDKESFPCEDVSDATGIIAAVKTACCLKRGGTGDRAHTFLRDFGGTDRYTANDKILGAVYNIPLEQIFLTDPNTSAAWLAAGVNGSEVGVEASVMGTPGNGPEWTAGQIHVLFAGRSTKPRVFSDLGMVYRA